MVDTTTLLTYSLIVLGFVLIPGLATLLSVARATTSGTKAGVSTVAGIAVGDVLHTFMAVIGISAIIAASASLFTLVKFLGVSYLIYLGVKAILAKPSSELGQGQASVTVRQAFRHATIAEALNPKTALFFLAFLPQFVDPVKGSVAIQLALLGILFAVIGFCSTLLYALAAGWLGAFLRRNPTALKLQGKFVGSVYCGVGVQLALQQR